MEDTFPLTVLVALGLAVLGLTLLARVVRVTPPVVAAARRCRDRVPDPGAGLLCGCRPRSCCCCSCPRSCTGRRSTPRCARSARTCALSSSTRCCSCSRRRGRRRRRRSRAGAFWPVAWVLGAVVAPTDATAVAAVARSASASAAHHAARREPGQRRHGTRAVRDRGRRRDRAARRSTGSGAIGGFVLSYAGGVAAGLLVAWLASRVRRVLHDPLLDNTVSVLTPFAAFLLAEQVHASGVLAVVVAGLAMSQIGPLLIAAQARLRARAFWQVSHVPAERVTVRAGRAAAAQRAGGPESSTTIAIAVGAALLVSATVIGTRLAWMYTVPYLVHALDRRPGTAGAHARRPPPAADRLVGVPGRDLAGGGAGRPDPRLRAGTSSSSSRSGSSS